MSSANNLFQVGSKEAKWARIYVNDLETKTFDAVDINADNLLLSGTANVNLLISQTDVSAPNGKLSGNTLLLGVDDAITTWVSNTVQGIPVTALKSQLDINIGGIAFLPLEFFEVRYQNVNISTSHQIIVTFNLDPNQFALAIGDLRELLANLNIQTVCVAGEARMRFVNVAGVNLPSAGTFPVASILRLNILIC